MEKGKQRGKILLPFWFLAHISFLVYREGGPVFVRGVVN